MILRFIVAHAVLAHAVLGVSILLRAATGSAQPPADPTTNESSDTSLLERARSAYNEARIVEAQTLLRRVFDGDLENREQLVGALALRTLVHYAVRAPQQARQDLERLASLDALAALGEGLPPALEKMRQQTRATPLDARLAIQQKGESLELRLRVENDPYRLVDDHRLWVDAGKGWHALRTPHLLTPIGTTFRYYAELLAADGFTLAEVGSRQSPFLQTTTMQPPPEGSSQPAQPQEKDATGAASDSDDELWLWLGLGAVAVLAAGVTAVALTSQSEPETRFSGPQVSGWP